jgi:hypothetical protein
MPSLKQALEILHHPKENENLEQIEAFKHIAQQRLAKTATIVLPEPTSPCSSLSIG